jgi:hypothetical protein
MKLRKMSLPLPLPSQAQTNNPQGKSNLYPLPPHLHPFLHPPHKALPCLHNRALNPSPFEPTRIQPLPDLLQNRADARRASVLRSSRGDESEE